jgi:hypothetical protein
MCVFGMPFAASSAILARRAVLCGVLGARTQASSVWRCSADIGRAPVEFGMEEGYAAPALL